jgi:hypothetical protein
MEELAGFIGSPRDLWGVLGLLSQIDLEYARNNSLARGKTARQQAEGLLIDLIDLEYARNNSLARGKTARQQAEGLLIDLCFAQERWCRLEELKDSLDRENRLEKRIQLEDALSLFTIIVEMTFDRWRRGQPSNAGLLSVLDLMESILKQDIEAKICGRDSLRKRLISLSNPIGTDVGDCRGVLVSGLRGAFQDLQ